MLTFSHLDADAFENPQKNIGRKRPRSRKTVACYNCRKSKVRCDRKSPCKPCQDRGIEQCTYSRSKSPTASEQAKPEITPPNTEVDLPPLQQPTPRSSDSEIVDPQPVLPHNKTGVIQTRSFKGSDFKTRVIGGTHWMAVCNDLPVIGAMLEKNPDFQPMWKTFAEVKSLLRATNSVPARLNWDRKNPQNLLPDLPTCKNWISRFCETYGRLYLVVDQKCLLAELEGIFAAPLDPNEVHVIKIILVIAIAMQTDKSQRLCGRVFLQEAESYIHTSTKFQKPCIGVLQALLLMIIMKTITSSETDKLYSLLGIMGQTTQMALSMGLQRNPALFPGVTPYYAEVRKRLWACFFRLNLDYCIRSGSNFSIRLEDVDCGIPTPIDLMALSPASAMEQNAPLNQDQRATDQAFNIAAIRLAMVIAPLHQQLCSASPKLSNEARSRMCEAFQNILRDLPLNLQEGAPSYSPVEKLQKASLIVHVHSFMNIITLNSVLGVPLNNSQKGDLYELWDNSVSILYQLQEALQNEPELSIVAYHLLWTDLARAALIACLVVGRLRNINLGTTVSNAAPPTLVVFQQLLLKCLDTLAQILAGKYQLGPYVAKTRLLLAVAATVTSSLINDFSCSQQDSKFYQVGIMAAENVVNEMERSLNRKAQESTFPMLQLDSLSTSVPLVSPPLTLNWADNTQLSDPFYQMALLGSCDTYTEPESSNMDMEPDVFLPYSMAQFAPASTIQSTPDFFWGDE